MTGILTAMFNRGILGMVLVITLLVSCSAEQGVPKSVQMKEQPDIQLSNATYTIGRDAENPITIQAFSISLYLKTNKALLEDITFEQQDQQGQVDLTGSAEKATVDTENYNVQLQGSIKISKKTENFTIETENLSWTNDSQLLQSDEKSPVYVSFNDGDTISGTGFSGNLKEGIYEFSSIEKGVLGK